MDKYPDHVVVAGGGRWARVITAGLCDLLPQSAFVTIYSPHCADSMDRWAKEKNFHNRVSSSSVWPDFSPGQSYAMIVANAARDHYRTAMKALENRVPVLVEKPVALSLSDTQHLLNISRENHVRLAPAHVFLFAPYLEQFSELVSGSGQVSSIRIQWTDPKGEFRHGEKKHYDPSLPVYADWMPHVLSILSTLIPIHSSKCQQVRFLKGGAQLLISLQLGEVSCEIELTRNDDSRKRIVEVETDSEKLRLDFSTEPGVVYRGGYPLSEGEPGNWEEGKRPVTSMLDAFLQWATNDEKCDKRLDMELGLHASKLVDEIGCQYQALQGEWLSLALNSYDKSDESLRYGLGELLQSQGAIPPEELDVMLEKIGETLAGKEGSYWMNKFTESSDYGRLIRELAANG